MPAIVDLLVIKELPEEVKKHNNSYKLEHIRIIGIEMRNVHASEMQPAINFLLRRMFPRPRNHSHWNWMSLTTLCADWDKILQLSLLDVY